MDSTIDLSAEMDVVIIGGGPAGATAAIYTSRADLKTLVIDKGLTAGALGMTSKIANFPGFPEEISGADLNEKIRSQAQKFGAVFTVDKIQGVDFSSSPKMVFGNVGTYKAKTVIIASGAMGKSQMIAGEEVLLGRGVSYCATCDAAFYRNKVVALAGNTDEAIHEALFLTRFAHKVYFISPTPQLNAPQPLIEALTDDSKVEVIKGAAIREITGAEKVEGIRIAPRGEAVRLVPLDGVFLYLHGNKPLSDFLMGQLETSEDGYIKVDEHYQSSINGVFAVGDVIFNHVKQAIVSAAEGAIAGIQVEKHLHGRANIRTDWAK